MADAIYECSESKREQLKIAVEYLFFFKRLNNYLNILHILKQQNKVTT